MSAYTIIIKKSVIKELDDIPEKDQTRIIEHLKLLSENPWDLGIEKLQGRNEYKLRVGRYRIIFDIETKKKFLTVYMIDLRNDIYKRLRRKI